MAIPLSRMLVQGLGGQNLGLWGFGVTVANEQLTNTHGKKQKQTPESYVDLHADCSPRFHAFYWPRSQLGSSITGEW